LLIASTSSYPFFCALIQLSAFCELLRIFISLHHCQSPKKKKLLASVCEELIQFVRYPHQLTVSVPGLRVLIKSIYLIHAKKLGLASHWEFILPFNCAMCGKKLSALTELTEKTLQLRSLLDAVYSPKVS
jgi:hypothetical protein